MDKLDSLNLSLANNLNQLQSAMNAVRRTQPPAPIFDPSLEVKVWSGGVSRREERKVKMHRLLKLHAGMQLTDTLRQKIERLLDDEQNEHWLGRFDLVDGQDPGYDLFLNLVEKLTVHETYFYRDGNQLDHLRRNFLRPMLVEQKQKARPTVRIWSAACSTGEEPYTMAMLLVLELMSMGEAQWGEDGEVRIASRWQIEILGTDISRKALDTARKASYAQVPGSLSAFREFPRELSCFMQFSENGSGHSPKVGTVKASITRLVNFEQYNLNSLHTPMAKADLVLCRNVLIYFDDVTRYRVQKSLHAAIGQVGAMVLGPSDVLMMEGLFRPVWGGNSVFYLKI